MSAPALSSTSISGQQWLQATLHVGGRGALAPAGLNSGEETIIHVHVDHIVAVTDHHYVGDDGNRCCCTNLLLTTGAWIAVCGDPADFAALLGLTESE